MQDVARRMDQRYKHKVTRLIRQPVKEKHVQRTISPGLNEPARLTDGALREAALEHGRHIDLAWKAARLQP